MNIKNLNWKKVGVIAGGSVAFVVFAILFVPLLSKTDELVSKAAEVPLSQLSEYMNDDNLSVTPTESNERGISGEPPVDYSSPEANEAYIANKTQRFYSGYLGDSAFLNRHRDKKQIEALELRPTPNIWNEDTGHVIYETEDQKQYIISGTTPLKLYDDLPYRKFAYFLRKEETAERVLVTKNEEDYNFLMSQQQKGAELIASSDTHDKKIVFDGFLIPDVSYSLNEDESVWIPIMPLFEFSGAFMKEESDLLAINTEDVDYLIPKNQKWTYSGTNSSYVVWSDTFDGLQYIDGAWCVSLDVVERVFGWMTQEKNGVLVITSDTLNNNPQIVWDKRIKTTYYVPETPI